MFVGFTAPCRAVRSAAWRAQAAERASWARAASAAGRYGAVERLRHRQGALGGAGPLQVRSCVGTSAFLLVAQFSGMRHAANARAAACSAMQWLRFNPMLAQCSVSSARLTAHSVAAWYLSSNRSPRENLRASDPRTRMQPQRRRAGSHLRYPARPLAFQPAAQEPGAGRRTRSAAAARPQQRHAQVQRREILT